MIYAFFRVILSSKERKLRKGQGFHWDILLIGILTFISSIFGLPWMCSSVQSLAHSQALTGWHWTRALLLDSSSFAVMKKHAPGERPQVDYVIEQRMSGLLISLLVGAFVCFIVHLVTRNLQAAVYSALTRSD